MLPFTYKMFKLHNSYKLLLQQKEVEYMYDEYNIDEKIEYIKKALGQVLIEDIFSENERALIYDFKICIHYDEYV
jgi:hypothetical protein